MSFIGYLNFLRSTEVRCIDVQVSYLQFLGWAKEHTLLSKRASASERLNAARALSCLMATWSQTPDVDASIFQRWHFDNVTGVAFSLEVDAQGQQAEFIGYHLNEIRLIQVGFPFTLMGWDASGMRADALQAKRRPLVNFNLPPSHFLFTENIPNATPLSSLATTLPLNEVDLIITQVALNLRLAQDCFHFMHNQLTAGRILVEDLGKVTNVTYAQYSARPEAPLAVSSLLTNIHTVVHQNATFYTLQTRYVPYIVGLSKSTLVVAIVVEPTQPPFNPNKDIHTLLLDLDPYDERVVTHSMDHLLAAWLKDIKPASRPEMAANVVTLPSDITVGNIDVTIDTLADLVIVAKETGAWVPPRKLWPVDLMHEEPEINIPNPVTEIQFMGLFYHIHVDIKKLTMEVTRNIMHMIKEDDRNLSFAEHMAKARRVQYEYRHLRTFGVRPLTRVMDYLRAATQRYREEPVPIKRNKVLSPPR